MQKLEGTTAWQVRYYGNGGNRTYRLTPGQKYVFQRDSQNFLQLYKQPAAVVEEPPVLPQ